LNRVLQFVPDGRHEIAIRCSPVDQNPKQSIWAHHRHLE
jgi:hypothetical protein